MKTMSYETRTEYITVKIRIGNSRPKMHFFPSNEAIEYTADGDDATIHVPELHYLNSIIVRELY